MRIIVVEDDPLQASSIVDALRSAIPDGRIERLATESAFYEALPGFADQLPSAIVMDVMLRWADPNEAMVDPPDEVKRNGFYRAGIRCVHRLVERPTTSNIPVVLYTVLSDGEDLNVEIQKAPKNVTYVSKTEDPSILAEHVRQRIGPSRPP